MERMDIVMVGAEAVVESGGIINTVCSPLIAPLKASTMSLIDRNVPNGSHQQSL